MQALPSGRRESSCKAYIRFLSFWGWESPSDSCFILSFVPSALAPLNRAGNQNERTMRGGWTDGWNLTSPVRQLNDPSQNFPAAQRLRLCSSNAGSTGLIPGEGTKNPHAAWHNNKKRKTKMTLPKCVFSLWRVLLRALWLEEASLNLSAPRLLCLWWNIITSKWYFSQGSSWLKCALFSWFVSHDEIFPVIRAGF